MRGATSATAGSARCWASRPGKPGGATQSASTNATSGVAAIRRPVLRAAAGPRFAGWRT